MCLCIVYKKGGLSISLPIKYGDVNFIYDWVNF